MIRFFQAAALGLFCTTFVSAADLVGHGGPVRAIAVTPDGSGAFTASFDATVIRWSLGRGQATQIMRFHNGAVNALALLPDGRLASAGEDGRIGLWTPGEATPARILEGHKGLVAALAVSADGKRLGSASWDGTARLWSIAADGPPGSSAQVLEHAANVNGIGFLPDGRIVTAAYDGGLRLFANDGGLARTITFPTSLSVLAVAGDGGIVVGGADGVLRLLSVDGAETATLPLSQTPLSSLALSPDGKRIAAAGFRGTLAIVDRANAKVERLMDGPSFPVWSLAFSADGKSLFTGGAARVVRRWSVETGEPLSPIDAGVSDVVPARLRGHPGAEVFKACAVCHALTPEPRGGNLAGPTLAGIFGRKIATAPGYDFSPALKDMNIVWTEETIQKLFEVGPTAYTPGTKMPEQKIIRAEDREALTDFLKAAQQP